METDLYQELALHESQLIDTRKAIAEDDRSFSRKWRSNRLIREQCVEGLSLLDANRRGAECRKEQLLTIGKRQSGCAESTKKEESPNSQQG